MFYKFDSEDLNPDCQVNILLTRLETPSSVTDKGPLISGKSGFAKVRIQGAGLKNWGMAGLHPGHRLDMKVASPKTKETQSKHFRLIAQTTETRNPAWCGWVASIIVLNTYLYIDICI